LFGPSYLKFFIPARPQAAGYMVGICYENSEENEDKPLERKFVVLAFSTDSFRDEGNQSGNTPFQSFNIIGLLNSS
jgi:hypothetical protein